MRASDPIFEVGLTMGGHKQEDSFWQQRCTALAARFGHEGEVETQVVCVDPRRQWSRWRNVWHSAAIRSTLYMLGAPRASAETAVQARSRGCLTLGRRCRSRLGPQRAGGGDRAGTAGRRVKLVEGSGTVGGGCRSEELTLPGFVHDTCSTVHSLALISPFLKSLPLAEHGLELAHPAAPLAHPFDDGSAVMLERSVAETARRPRGGRAGLRPALRTACPQCRCAHARHPWPRFGCRDIRSSSRALA